MLKRVIVSAALLAAAVGLPSSGLAMTAWVTTDLNVRAGPGPHHPVVAVIDADASIEVFGCTESQSWCQVSWDGTQGWAYASYIAFDAGGTRVLMPELGAVEIPVVTYDEGGAAGGAAVGAVGGAVAGALIAGPVGAAVGGAAGAAAGASGGVLIDPPERVVTYVRQREVDPVYLEGEVVVGARVPPAILLHDVPDYGYRYAYVNGQYVLIDPASYQIVYIAR